jgi:hypothetical protein
LDHSQVEIFESENEEFVVPMDRYVWRLQCLEEVICKGVGGCEGVEISTYFEDDETENPDADLILYQGRLEDFAQLDVESQDLHLNNCGYESIRIGYDHHKELLVDVVSTVCKLTIFVSGVSIIGGWRMDPTHALVHGTSWWIDLEAQTITSVDLA